MLLVPTGPAALAADSMWIDARDSAPELELGPEGVRGPFGFAPWDLVFGVALVPRQDPDTAYVLMPRKPPAPPWFAVRREDLPTGVDLPTFALQVSQRTAATGYRRRIAATPTLPPRDLLERVLDRAEVPGALEVPIGVGPGGWARRTLDVTGTGVVGGLLGLYVGIFGGPALAAVGATVGFASGAAIPMGFGSSWRSAPFRRRRPRVLVLAPDGCVIGLPEGPRAFAWSEVGGFSEAELPTARSARPALQLRLAEGQVAGLLDESWFGAPLALIVAVAEAYRKRNTRAA